MNPRRHVQERPRPPAAGEPAARPVLKEAELTYAGQRLGPVGGRIVAEVILSLLDLDRTSYLSVNPFWRPTVPIAPLPGQFRTGDLIKFVR
ncbi:hypothetical protein [Actinoplanes sp. NPDC026670]|uniref:hypothetical protein n=1 Tax=Actinoplanes sp. NPDC026670 TaxID=3154700 RepID=UPI0033E01720